MNDRLLPLVLGVFLAVAGVLLLLRNLEILPAGFSVWPVALIAIGAVVVAAGLRQERGGAPPAETASMSLEGAHRGRLILKHGAGVLEVGGAATAGRLFEGTFAGGVRQETRRDAESVEVTLRHPSDPERLLRQSRGLGWTIALTQEVPLDLELQTGASRVHLDLDQVQVGELRIQTGASDVDVRLPAHGRSRVRVSAGAADVRLHVPPGVEASITTRSALASTSIDETRFPPAAGGFRSPGFESAQDRVEIELEGGVASFSVR